MDVQSQDHVINIPRETTTTTTNNDNNVAPPPPQLASRTSSMATARDDGTSFRLRRQASPLNSGVWISIELVVYLSQIIASILVLRASKDEHPHAPLVTWIIGYTAVCAANIPYLYWRYTHRYTQILEQAPSNSTQNNTNNSNDNNNNSFTSGQMLEQESFSAVGNNRRIYTAVDHFKMALDLFSAVWFVVGNIWVFGGQSVSEAPNLYRLCIVFLTLSFIGYALPLMLCAMICCCLPCIISIMCFREEPIQARGASEETIDALPKYKFKSQSHTGENNGPDSESSDCGGVVAAGTDKERMIAAEDAVCCICLTKYEDNEDVRELLSSHLFHMDSVDKWLKINSLCPLCKAEICPEGEASGAASENHPGHGGESQQQTQ